MAAAAARAQACDGIHPGYGFLSENSGFAQACRDAGLVFVGPTADNLRQFGDKARARALARECQVPVLEGMDHGVTQAQAEAFFARLPEGSAMVIKAVSGGGGRGLRVVRAATEIAEAFARCQSEAASAFGDNQVYVEQWLPRARHVEVQVLGDGRQVRHLWERECSLQRRQQ